LLSAISGTESLLEGGLVPRPFWLISLIALLSLLLALPWWNIQYNSRVAKYNGVAGSLNGRAVTIRYSSGETLEGFAQDVVPGRGLWVRGPLSSGVFLSCLWRAPEELTGEERFSVVTVAFPAPVKYGSMAAVLLVVYLPVNFLFSRVYWWRQDRKRFSASEILKDNSRTRYK